VLLTWQGVTDPVTVLYVPPLRWVPCEAAVSAALAASVSCQHNRAVRQPAAQDMFSAHLWACRGGALCSASAYSTCDQPVTGHQRSSLTYASSQPASSQPELALVRQRPTAAHAVAERRQALSRAAAARL